MTEDEKYMKKAVLLAKKAAGADEVPVGAVVVLNGKIVGRGYNKREKSQNAIWHAEMVAINRACKKLKSWRLDDATLFVSLEPCMMCLGACLNARLKRVVFGAFDPKGENKKEQSICLLNHNMKVCGGVLEEECKMILQNFFSVKRIKTKEAKK